MADVVKKERKNSRTAKGTGHIRQREDGRWECQITLGQDLGTGKQRRKSIYGKTQSEVRKKLQAIQKEVDEGTYIEPTKMTYGIWLDEWLKNYLSDKSMNTRKGYESCVRVRIKPLLGSARLSALTLPDIQAFINKQQEPIPHLELDPLGGKSIKNLHGVLSKSFKQAIACGYIRINPATGCKLPRWDKPEMLYLDSNQLAAFLQAIRGHKHELLLILAVLTGMREGELVGFTWDSVNFVNGTIYINKQLQLISKDNYKESLPKWNKKRIISPAPAIMQLLREHKVHQEQQAELAGAGWGNKGGYVFTNEIGEHLKIPTVYKNFKRIVEKMAVTLNTSELADTRFHDLRHTYAVTALQAGDSIQAVSENMGHHSTAFTLDTYGHFTPHMREKSANIMDGVFKAATSTL